MTRQENAKNRSHYHNQTQKLVRHFKHSLFRMNEHRKEWNYTKTRSTPEAPGNNHSQSRVTRMALTGVDAQKNVNCLKKQPRNGYS